MWITAASAVFFVAFLAAIDGVGGSVDVVQEIPTSVPTTGQANENGSPIVPNVPIPVPAPTTGDVNQGTTATSPSSSPAAPSSAADSSTSSSATTSKPSWTPPPTLADSAPEAGSSPSPSKSSASASAGPRAASGGSRSASAAWTPPIGGFQESGSSSDADAACCPGAPPSYQPFGTNAEFQQGSQDSSTEGGQAEGDGEKPAASGDPKPKSSRATPALGTLALVAALGIGLGLFAWARRQI